jgi:hypothetical protein
MHATKETCILPWAAAGAGIAGVWYWRCRELGTKPVRNPAISSRHAGAAVGAAVLISALFFSSFLTNPKGPVEAITGYTSHIHRGLGGETDDVDYTDGKAHVKPPTYFAAQLVGRWEPRQWGKPFLRNNPVRPFTELLLVILFTVGAVRIAREKGSEPGAEFRRFILIYSLVLFAFYSGIPYKTPWCAIGFMHGVIMVAGVGFAAVLDLNNKHLRTVAIVLVVMGAIDLVRQDVVLNGAVSSDTSRNPFAYVHAVPDSRRAAERVVEAAASHPQGNNLKVGVVVPDPWPLPWYLRTLNKVGYWEAPPDIPVDQMPVLILSAEFADLIASIEDTHQVDMRGLRPAEHVIVAIRKDVWEAMGK